MLLSTVDSGGHVNESCKDTHHAKGMGRDGWCQGPPELTPWAEMVGARGAQLCDLQTDRAVVSHETETAGAGGGGGGWGIPGVSL